MRRGNSKTADAADGGKSYDTDDDEKEQPHKQIKVVSCSLYVTSTCHQ